MNRVLDLDRAVRGPLSLSTVPGAVDYLAEELRHLDGVTILRRRGDGLTVELDGPLSVLARVPYFQSAAVPLPSDLDGAVAALVTAVDDGVLAGLPASVRFRVGPIGDARWELRDALTAAGWHNDPGAWDVNIEPDDAPPHARPGQQFAVRDVGGWRAEIGGLYWTRRFGELLRAPASTNPVIASVMARLAKIEDQSTVLDPFCGAGTLLATVGRGPFGRVLSGDHDARWAAATAENLRRVGVDGVVWRGDARAIPMADGVADRIVSNLPFGKRVGSHAGNQTLYPAVLSEVARLLPRKGRAVFLTEDKRLFVDTVQRTRGLRIIKDITFTTGGAHPSAYVVTTRRGRLGVLRDRPARRVFPAIDRSILNGPPAWTRVRGAEPPGHDRWRMKAKIAAPVRVRTVPMMPIHETSVDSAESVSVAAAGASVADAAAVPTTARLAMDAAQATPSRRYETVMVETLGVVGRGFPQRHRRVPGSREALSACPSTRESEGVEDTHAAGRVPIEAHGQAPQEVSGGTDERPRQRPIPIETGLVDDQIERASDASSVGQFVESGPQQLRHLVLRIADDHHGIDRHPGALAVVQDVVVVQVVIDEEFGRVDGQGAGVVDDGAQSGRRERPALIVPTPLHGLRHPRRGIHCAWKFRRVGGHRNRETAKQPGRDRQRRPPLDRAERMAGSDVFQQRGVRRGIVGEEPDRAAAVPPSKGCDDVGRPVVRPGDLEDGRLPAAPDGNRDPVVPAQHGAVRTQRPLSTKAGYDGRESRSPLPSEGSLAAPSTALEGFRDLEVGHVSVLLR
ncbi:hypothetical protein STSO111631_09975 [Stackebrandtia soli]